jgi:hypothetical protein
MSLELSSWRSICAPGGNLRVKFLPLSDRAIDSGRASSNVQGALFDARG